MLQSMKHRGPDSTGYALYATPTENVVLRYTTANTTTPRDFEFADRIRRNMEEAERRINGLGAKIVDKKQETDYAYRLVLDYSGDLKKLADQIEDIQDCEVLSLGHSLEIIKDLGDADTVCAQYHLEQFQGTHAIGHVRMATESDVDISGAHPYWAYPFSDIAVVHKDRKSTRLNSSHRT